MMVETLGRETEFPPLQLFLILEKFLNFKLYMEK